MSNSSPQGFPRELLQQSADARRRYFETKVIAHQRLFQVYEDLLHVIRYPAGTSLILVSGPTGVGKTTLLQRIVKQLVEDAACDPTIPPDHIPVMAMEAPSPDSGNFSWKDYFTRALIAADEPLVADKVAYELGGTPQSEQFPLSRRLTTPDLRRVLEKCLSHRRPRAFIVDEAQHIKKMASGRRLLDQMDTLKSLANMTSTVHVLIGTYELLGLMHLSAQLSRRSVEIHFPRYHAEEPEDLKEFKKLLRTFQRHLPLPEEPDLESHYAFFYEQCLGCTGMLKTLLNKALGAALEQEERTLTSQRWEQHAEPPQKLKDMLQRIKQDEATLKNQNDESHRNTLREMLGLHALPPQDGLLREETSLSSTPPVTSPQSKSRRRVGQRNAKRDLIGRGAESAK